jgi:hypothetical protein
MSPKTTPRAPTVRMARYFPSGAAGRWVFSVPAETASYAPEGDRDGGCEPEDSPESVFNAAEV